MVIPSDNMISSDESRRVVIAISFSHPFEGLGMPMARPKVVSAMAGGNIMDLLPDLKKAEIMGQPAWQTSLPIRRPGAIQIFVEPIPYWEPAEDAFIIHYTKTVIAAFDDDTGWDAPLGLKTEILPLVRPLGLYAGNLFQGTVLMDGKPVPGAEVEVEFYPEDEALKAPADLMITQTVKADGGGVFSYAAPWPGWWGFAALNRADYTLKHEGAAKEVELGAVIWVRFETPLR